jgi:hypothetical protein
MSADNAIAVLYRRGHGYVVSEVGMSGEDDYYRARFDQVISTEKPYRAYFFSPKERARALIYAHDLAKEEHTEYGVVEIDISDQEPERKAITLPKMEGYTQEGPIYLAAGDEIYMDAKAVGEVVIFTRPERPVTIETHNAIEYRDSVIKKQQAEISRLTTRLTDLSEAIAEADIDLLGDNVIMDGGR